MTIYHFVLSLLLVPLKIKQLNSVTKVCHKGRNQAKYVNVGFLFWTMSWNLAQHPEMELKGTNICRFHLHEKEAACWMRLC